MDVETEARLYDVDSTEQPALQNAVDQALSRIEKHRRMKRNHPVTHPDGLIVRPMVQISRFIPDRSLDKIGI